tara:strand:- start:265 stop:852 length:588 start_codon:yes stop_codon:yes gene_type:complete
MSTNSLVAYLREDGSVVSSYVHYDGYATGVGEMLLENYNSDKCARDLATTLGYASSLSETVAASHEDRANTDEAETYESYEDFEEYIRECSHLEYVYVWDTHKDEWLVATWETIKRKVHNGICSDYEFESHWNGFESLITLYVREGRETAVRYRKMVSEGKVDIEYLDYASELEDSVLKWNRIGVSEVARNALAA